MRSLANHWRRRRPSAGISRSRRASSSSSRSCRSRHTRGCSSWCRIRRAAGKVADLDVAEASANVNMAESELSVARGRYAEARRALELLLGRYPSADIEVSARFTTLPGPVAPGLPMSLLARRPDIMAAERRVLSAFRTEEAARLALLPTIGLALDAGRLTDRLLSLLHLNPWLAHSAVGAAVPIYEGGALRADIKIATAEQEAAVAQYGSVVLRAFGEVEQALTNEDLLAQQSASDQRALDDRITSVRIATIKYNVGTIDLLSVLILQATSSRIRPRSSSCAMRDSRTGSTCTSPLAGASAPRQPRSPEGHPSGHRRANAVAISAPARRALDHCHCWARVATLVEPARRTPARSTDQTRVFSCRCPHPSRRTPPQDCKPEAPSARRRPELPARAGLYALGGRAADAIPLDGAAERAARGDHYGVRGWRDVLQRTTASDRGPDRRRDGRHPAGGASPRRDDRVRRVPVGVRDRGIASRLDR